MNWKKTFSIKAKKASKHMQKMLMAIFSCYFSNEKIDDSSPKKQEKPSISQTELEVEVPSSVSDEQQQSNHDGATDAIPMDISTTSITSLGMDFGFLILCDLLILLCSRN